MALGFTYPANQHYDAADIKAALRGREHEVVTHFRGEPNRELSSRSKPRWGSKGSFKLELHGKWAGRWSDFETGRGGDIIDLVQVETGSDFAGALDFLASWAGIAPGTTAPPRPKPTVVEEPNDDSLERIARALAIWDDTQPLGGTLAEQYLRSRYIEVPDPALDALRFHPACPWPHALSQKTEPALIALVTDIITGEPIAIHVTALTGDGSKLGRRCYGPKSGGAIKLFSDGLITSGDLAVGEGIETTLSLKPLGYDVPVWALLDAGELRNFPALPNVERLWITVDNDRSETGQKAARECSDRWIAAGKRVRLLCPDEPGDDLNDLLRKEREASQP